MADGSLIEGEYFMLEGALYKYVGKLCFKNMGTGETEKGHYIMWKRMVKTKPEDIVKWRNNLQK